MSWVGALPVFRPEAVLSRPLRRHRLRGPFTAKCEKEGRSFVDIRLGPDAAVVPAHDPLDDGQAHPGALVVFAPVQSLEDAKQLVCVLHIEAGSIVPDVVHRLSRLAWTTPNLDAGWRPLLA